jgi:hypothetical protein
LETNQTPNLEWLLVNAVLVHVESAQNHLSDFDISGVDHLAILDIRRQLLAARMRAALALAIRPTANSLLGTVPRRQKRALAVKTTAGLVHVDSSGFEQEIPEEN